VRKKIAELEKQLYELHATGRSEQVAALTDELKKLQAIITGYGFYYVKPLGIMSELFMAVDQPQTCQEDRSEGAAECANLCVGARQIFLAHSIEDGQDVGLV